MAMRLEICSNLSVATFVVFIYLLFESCALVDSNA